MCRAVRCRICSKTTWSGCGSHVDQVLAGIPEVDRCPGHSEPETDRGPFSTLVSRS